VSLGGALNEKLYAIAAAHFDAVELFEDDLTFHDGALADVRRLIGDLGLSVCLFQPFFDFEAVPDAQFQRSLDRAERKFDVMAELGAPLMLVSANSSPDAIADQARTAAQLNALAERAAKRGLKLGYEALAWGAHVRSWRDAWTLIQRADHPALGLILDSFHSLVQGEDPAELSALPGEKIFHLQLSDAPRLDLDRRTLGRHFRCFPGLGVLDVAGFAASALRAGYAGPLSLEAFGDDLRSAPPRQSAVEAARSLNFVEEQARRLLGASPANADLFMPPAVPPIEGVAFIEFAANQEASQELGVWLRRLGFAYFGAHRSKPAGLYQQGRLAIVVNWGQDSFAYAYRRLHGVSVCALGVRVDDREGMIARARAYDYKVHEEQIGSGEYRMPAIRAPDGSLFHIVDGAYDPTLDFVASPDGEEAEADLAAVDHIGRVVPAGQFESWLLFYKALLGLVPDASWDLPDPHGLVHSRALADAGRHVRFPLAFSEGNRTVVAKALSSFAGSGVNQVAFSTDDIFGAVADLRARGARFLPIPANYYDELRAAGALDGETIDRMAEASILYDSDGAGGAFFHAYTETFHDRFFFELVQRTGGYDQYGAANAPVRMAAQARRLERHGAQA
jgi:4-hydroxyphenylpyruvate dioxygenase